MKTTILVYAALFFAITSTNGYAKIADLKDVDHYLRIDCVELIKKKQTDSFLKNLKKKIEKLANSQQSESKRFCEELGEAQYSRLLEDEYLLQNLNK